MITRAVKEFIFFSNALMHAINYFNCTLSY